MTEPSGDAILRTEKIHRLRRMAAGMREQLMREDCYSPGERYAAMARADRWEEEAKTLEGVDDA